MQKLILFIMGLLCAAVIQVQAQPGLQHNITGTVLSAKDGTALAGASVFLQKSGTNAVTDAKGKFSILSASAPDTLVVSHIGYREKRVFIQESPVSPLTIRLEASSTRLQGITISTGYQQIPKERATGSFDFIDNKLLNRSVSPDILSRLKGIASGVLFDPSSEGYGNALGISIRGQSTIFANKNPLIILNNFPYNGDINNINPNDVQSITILKDAAAASIWGARSGNGVIVINTKQGRYDQPPEISLNSNITVQGKPNPFYLPNMSSADYIGVETALFDSGYYNSRISSRSHPALTPAVEILLKEKNGKISAANAAAQLNSLKQKDIRNDISKYLYRNIINQQYALNISGGGRYERYYVSLGFDKDIGQLFGNNNERFTVNATNTYSLINHKLDITTGISYTQTNTKSDGIDPSTISYGNYNILYPYAQVADGSANHLSIAKYRQAFIDTTGNGALLDWHYRPLDELMYADNKTKGTDYQANLGLKYKIIPGLNIEIKYQYEKGISENTNLHSLQSYYTRDYINQFTQIDHPTGTVTHPVPVGGIIQYNNNDYTSQNIRGQVNYNRKWGINQLIVLGGAEISDFTQDMQNNRQYGYDKHGNSSLVNYLDYYRNYVTGFISFIQNGAYSQQLSDRYVSFFANGAYTYKDKYTLSGSIRKDASNLFGVSSNQKWVPLWSVGASWLVSKESFFHPQWCSYLKFRVTYGYSGNIDKTVAADLITISLRPNIYGNQFAYIQNPPNPDLRWEKTGQVNVGLDYEIVNDRISGSIEYYKKRGIDLMGYAALPPSSGLTQYKGNTADMTGEGYDITISTKNINTSFQWVSTLLFNYTRNSVTNYKAAPASIGTYVEGPLGINPVIGYPVSSLYSYRFAGLDHQTGNPEGLLAGKMSEDYGGIISSIDRSNMVYSGRKDPAFFGSLKNDFSYKGFALSFIVSYKMGYYFRRSTINYSSLFTSSSIGNKDFDKRWRKPGDEKTTNVPSMIYPSNRSRDEFYQYSSALIDKGDQIRLQDIRLSYDLTKIKTHWLPFKDIQFYLYASNLRIIWKANKDGIDPDYVPSPGSYYSLPPAKSFSGGLRINF